MSYIRVFVREFLLLFAADHTCFCSFWMFQLCGWAISLLLFWITNFFTNGWLVPGSLFWECWSVNRCLLKRLWPVSLEQVTRGRTASVWSRMNPWLWSNESHFYTHLFTCARTYTLMWRWSTTSWWVPSLCHADPWDPTPMIRLFGKHLYLLSHPTGRGP